MNIIKFKQIYVKIVLKISSLFVKISKVFLKSLTNFSKFSPTFIKNLSNIFKKFSSNLIICLSFKTIVT